MGKLFTIIFIVFTPLSLEAGRVDDLEAEVRSLRTQLELTQKREEEYRKQVEKLGRKVDELSLAVNKNKADYQVELDELRRKIEGLNTTMLALKLAVEEISGKMDSLPAAVQGNVVPSPGQFFDPAGPQPAALTPAPVQQLSYKQLYQAAVDQVQRKNYDAARSQFEAFLKAYPKTELSDNAQFWLGECYYAQGYFQRAVLEYDAVRKNYPDGNKVPAALWKMALAFDRLGNREVAQSFLKELIEKHPQSPETGLAREKLGSWR